MEGGKEGESGGMSVILSTTSLKTTHTENKNICNFKE